MNKNQCQQTSRKAKVIGTVQYINPSTGEIEDFQVTSFQDRDFNFHKVWMKNFINSIDLVGNQKTKFAFWVIDNITKENLIPMTYRQMAEKSGISLGTVRDTMKILLDADFLRQINRGCYIVHPNIVFKGTQQSRLNVLSQYELAEHIALTDIEKLNNLQHSISELQKQADGLLKKINEENKAVVKEGSIA